MFDLQDREVVRITVKLCESGKDAVNKKFSIDPQITSFEVLQRLLSRAFDIKCDFTISYLATDDLGEEIYLTLLSDWDLDAAIFSASNPILKLKVHLRPFDEGLQDWDFISPSEIPGQQKSVVLATPALKGLRKGFSTSLLHSAARESALDGRTNNFLTNLSNQVNRTMNSVQKVIGLWSENGEDTSTSNSNVISTNPPLSDALLKKFMDRVGRIVHYKEFRNCVAAGGVEPSLRKVVWRLLLGVFREDLNGAERMSYMGRWTAEYRDLKDRWKKLYLSKCLSAAHLGTVIAIKKDVIRTDRGHSFYAGDEENFHSRQLFDLLVTFAIYHPSVGYAQGMSDMASPLLIVQEDEAHAYICFCALMRRLGSTFQRESSAMLTKLQHLHDLTVHFDPSLAAQFRQRNISDMWWAHRWLLLELKREFPFEETLRVLEVQWALVPRSWLFIDEDLKLIEANRSQETCLRGAAFMSNLKDTPYLRLSSLRRLSAQRRSNARSEVLTQAPIESLGIDASPTDGAAAFQSLGKSSRRAVESTIMECPPAEEQSPNFIVFKDGVVELAPPEVLGVGNPFLLFLCFALVQLYRDRVIASCHDLCDISTFFTRTQRKHSLQLLLHRARHLFHTYLSAVERQREENEGFERFQISL